MCEANTVTLEHVGTLDDDPVGLVTDACCDNSEELKQPRAIEEDTTLVLSP